MLEEKKSFVHRAHLKPFESNKYFKCFSGLFQSIQDFLEFKNMVWKLGTLKTRGLPHIDHFLYISIQKGTYGIHLKKHQTL
jgi:hypothetical protein